MQAVKLSPEELLLEPVKSDWLLLCRVLPKGLPRPGDEPIAEGGKLKLMIHVL